MDHTITLDLSQRLNVANVISQSRGNTGEYRLNNQLLDMLEFTEEDIAKGGITSKDIERLGIKQYFWDPASNFTRDFRLKPAQWMRLKAVFETFNQFGRQDKDWLDPVLEQLGI